jgi:hypothetical protein
MLLTLLPHPSEAQISSSAPCSLPPRIPVLHLMWKRRSCTTIKKTGKITVVYVKFQIFGHKPGRQKIHGPAVADVPRPISTYVLHMVFSVPCHDLTHAGYVLLPLSTIESAVVNENENYELH